MAEISEATFSDTTIYRGERLIVDIFAIDDVINQFIDQLINTIQQSKQLKYQKLLS